VSTIFGSEVSRVCGVEEAKARGRKHRELEIPGFWEARGVEGFDRRRVVLWAYRRRRSEMLKVFGPEVSKV
jgi:hypothetical protein